MARRKIRTSKETLEKLYLVNEWSMKEIAEHLKCSTQTICNLIKEYKIPARSSRKHSEKTRKKMSQAKKGEKCCWFGKKRPEHSKALIGKFVGRQFTEETKRKMSLAKNGLWGGKYKGEECPHWVDPNSRKGPLNKNIRRLPEMKMWRESVFIRDNWTCQSCGRHGSVALNADHIRPLHQLIEENNITNLEQAIKCVALWDIENGRTLCVECHRKCDTYGRPKTR